MLPPWTVPISVCVLLPSSQHAGLEPFLDQSHDAPVRDAVLEKLHQPSVIESVEEASDVGIEHPVHLSPVDSGGQGIQSKMRTSPRSEAVGKAEEVDLVDRTQDLNDGALGDLVFQRGNSERPLPPVRLRDEASQDRPRPVRSPRQPSGEILEILFQPLPIVLPRLSVDSRSGVSLQREVCAPQAVSVVDMVQKRREPLLPFSLSCLTYPLERTWRAVPAQGPGRVLLGEISLGQPPSLHRFRGRFLGSVQRLPRYYGAVRLPTVVRHRRFPSGFPMRSVTQRATDDRGISRFPCEMLPCMRGVSDRAGSWRASRCRRARCCLPPPPRTSAPRSTRFRGACISRLNTRPAFSPVNASRTQSPAPPHDSGPVWVANPSPCETSIHYTSPV
jgi:hypothetical protein